MSKPLTIQDVAGTLGIHKSTVSLALSGKGNLSSDTRARIRRAARDLGYEPNPVAQRLATGHKNGLVALFSGLLDVGLATQKILLIQKELSAHAFEVPIYTFYEPDSGAGSAQLTQIRQLCRQRPRAIICAAQMVDPHVFEELAAYQREGGIIVTYDTPVDLSCDQVIFDREDNAYQAASHLLEQGHRHIGLGMSSVTGPQRGTKGDPQIWRQRGFQKALDAFGAVMRPEWSFRTPTYEEGGAEMARQFLALKERPTGMCIVNDYVAMAFMVEVMRAGVRVPDDLSIVSHDNQPIAAYCPVPLTSVTQPTGEIARTVVQLLRERIESEGVLSLPRTVVVKGELIRRASAGPLPTRGKNA